MKIVINDCHGGFGLSEEGEKRYLEIGGTPPLYGFLWHGIDRTQPALVQTLEELGDKAMDNYAQLKIVDIPGGTKYRIREFDGIEWIETEDEIRWEIAT